MISLDDSARGILCEELRHRVHHKVRQVTSSATQLDLVRGVQIPLDIQVRVNVRQGLRDGLACELQVIYD